MSHTTLSTIPKLIAHVLELEKLNCEAIFQRANLNLSTLNNSSQRIPMSDMYALWEAASSASNNPCFGLLAASLFQPAYLNGIGFAWMASDTIGDGLARFINNISMINTAVTLELVEQGDNVLVRYAPLDTPSHSSLHVHPCAIQLGLGFLLRMFRLTTGRPIPVSQVYVKHKISEKMRTGYQDFFTCHVQDCAETNGIEFHRDILNEKLPTADAELAAINDQAVLNYLKKQAKPEIVEKVSRCVLPLLASGCPNEEEIAVRLHMSRRTLQRKLSSANTSFGQLLTDLRLGIAKNCLTHTQTPVTDIAYQTGYSSPSAFSRAFKKVTGLTPNDYRGQTGHN